MTTLFLPLISISQTHASDPARAVELIIPGVVSAAIVQQPADNPGWVSGDPSIVTQYADAAKYGVTGLIAHNTGAGQHFFGLQIGDTITVNGSKYVVVDIDYYQALSPSSQFSEFIELVTGEHCTASQLFHRYYGEDSVYPVVMQTCIEYNGLNNWGRLFVVADGV